MLVAGIKAGLKIDDFAPRLSFFWGIGMNFYMASFFLTQFTHSSHSLKSLHYTVSQKLIIAALCDNLEHLQLAR